MENKSELGAKHFTGWRGKDQSVGNMVLKLPKIESMKAYEIARGEVRVPENEISILTEQGKEAQYLKRMGHHDQIGKMKTNTEY